MKTYSRKKSKDPQEVIMDLNDICRLCMGKEEELISIFNNKEPIPLTLRIVACVALEVFENDGLPNKICHPCKFQLEKFHSFRKKCESSDMKLRQHLKEITEKIGEHEKPDNSHGTNMDVSEEQSVTNDSVHAGPSTEEDLVGVTEGPYLHPDPEPENNSEGITLLPETDSTVTEACALKITNQLTTKVDAENEEVVVIEESDHQIMDDANLDTITEAVKATLASQPGLNVSGHLQLKVNKSDGKSVQVEVTAEDGSVIVMKLMTEKESELRSNKREIEANEDGELQVFQCPECPMSFARRIQLVRHVSAHKQQGGLSCGICEKWFSRRSTLVRHERIHTGGRPFQCKVCQKSFAQKEILFRHLMTHTGQKLYSSPPCPKDSTQTEPLRVYLTTRRANRPSDKQLYYCSLCPKIFSYRSSLSRHLVTHSGKMFKCRDCNKSFAYKSELRRHHLQMSHQL